ncbi:MAG: hypothetical protein IJD01_06385, partial [Clostridia bacterium]|nr:hypothetical protein [Clostridia bacterium]
MHNRNKKRTSGWTRPFLRCTEYAQIEIGIERTVILDGLFESQFRKKTKRAIPVGRTLLFFGFIQINALRSKATFSLLFSLLSFLWKRQFERREKNEKRK